MHREIDVQLRPEKMLVGRPFNCRQMLVRGLPEPRKIGKGNKQFLIVLRPTEN
jgi:hypothetical protein